MTKRQAMHRGDWESVFERLQELVMANSGEDEFEEIFKLLVAKLFDEKQLGNNYSFHLYTSPAETAFAINALIAQAAERWRGILELPAASRLTDEHLSICVEALQDYSLLDTSLEVLDGALEYLVSRVAKGAKGQYFTPRHVVECCVRIIDPSPDEIVLDPACGSGGFLIHTLNHVRGNLAPTNIAGYCEGHLWGCDFERRAIQVAKALMLAVGDGQANLFRLNSLILPGLHTLPLIQNHTESTPRLTIEDVSRLRFGHFRGFDVILTNPPFAGEIREADILHSYELFRKGRRLERDVLFLERCVHLLKPGGRLAIVLPHNKLASSSWAYVRDWLVQHVRIIAVLGLGRNTFLPHTHQKTNVLFAVKRERPVHVRPREDILFLISERDGKDSKGRIIARPNTNPESNAWVRADHDLEEIVTKFTDYVQSANIAWRRQ